MYAVIVWNMKNGVALGREELEVMSTSKLTVMNGRKIATGATVICSLGKIYGVAGFNHFTVS